MKTFCLPFALLVQLACYAQSVTHAEPTQVAIFLSCECPISQKYVPVLNNIYAEYGGKAELQWKFVVPDKISKKELRAFVKEYEVEFPIQIDDGKQSLTSRFNPTVTPQVVIRNNEILYSGAIDNWFYALGQYRQVITANYLVDALDQVLNGKAPMIRTTDAVGCPIAKRSR